MFSNWEMTLTTGCEIITIHIQSQLSYIRCLFIGLYGYKEDNLNHIYRVNLFFLMHFVLIISNEVFVVFFV